MKIGDRLKTLRMATGMSGEKVSEISGVNHSLIKKYETNRTVPKPNHINKLSNALNVSPYAITGENNHKFNTIGDLYGLLIMLDNIGFILIKKNDADYVSMELNESAKQFFDLRKGLETQDWRTYNILINDKLKNDLFLKWISKKELLKSCKVDEEDKYYLNLKKDVEELELLLQQSTEKL
ncbi:MAG: helix-turn-helix transcriptional regulator [Eubacterium sp.]|nr:helix-turn-helix transcriptional regulator [Eubacterium sp.]